MLNIDGIIVLICGVFLVGGGLSIACLMLAALAEGGVLCAVHKEFIVGVKF